MPALNTGTDFVSDTDALASEVNARFDAIETWANVTMLDGDNLQDDSVDTEHIADDAVEQAQIADAAVGTAQVIDANVTAAKLAADAVAPYRTLLAGVGNYPGSASGSYFFGHGSDKTSDGNLVESATANQALDLLQIDDADYTLTGKTTKLRLRVQQTTHAIAPGNTITIGLHRVTAIVAGTFTVASAVAGSTVVFTETAADTLAQDNSGDFNVPTDGLYIVAAVGVGASAIGSAHALAFQLQYHHV